MRVTKLSSDVILPPNSTRTVFQMQRFKSYALRYGIGIASFGMCLILAFALHYFSIKVDQGLLIIAALAVSAWYGGTGPGLMVAILIELVSMGAATPRQEPTHVLIFGELSRTAIMSIIVLLVSARRNAERRLLDQRRWLEVTLSSIDNAVITTDLNGVVSFMNPAAEAMTAWTYSRAKGKLLEEVFKIDNQEILHSHSQALSDVILRSQDGTAREIVVSAGQLRDKSDGIKGSVLVFRDVTERKQLQDQFRQAQKMEGIGRLAGGIAHDFNNLLTVILGYCEMARNKAAGNKPLCNDLAEVIGAGERAAGLVSQLLAFSRKQVLKPQIIDLSEIVANSERMLRRLIGEDIDLVCIKTDELAHVLADSGQIEQIILNFAVNARDAMPNGGKLTIETANVELDENYARLHTDVVPGRYVLLAISDTGHGMDSDTQARVFEPFFTTKEVGKGTGLGLSTVFGIVKQSGGHLWLYSEPGKGATFKVYFPVVDEPVESVHEVARVDSVRGNETLLLTEDDEAVRRLAESILKACGYNILLAASGAEAIGTLKQTPGIALLITDVVMPGMSGRELALEMEKIAPQTRVLYLSGYAENAIVHHGVLEAGLAFLPKPFTPDSLARKVREVLDQQCVRSWR